MELQRTDRTAWQLQWSAFNRRGIGVWSVGRDLLWVGCGQRTRSLAGFARREHQVCPDLIYNRRASGHCRSRWTGIVRVRVIDLRFLEPCHSSLNNAALAIEVPRFLADNTHAQF